MAVLGILSPLAGSTLGQDAATPPQDPAAAAPAAPSAPAAPADEPLPQPPAIPQAQLGPTLTTIEVNKNEPEFNVQYVKAGVLPVDAGGIWVLDFAFKPLRMQSVEILGKGRRRVYYLFYRVVNNTGEPRMFVPQFTLTTDTGKRYEDSVLPQAVDLIKAREMPELTLPLRGSVDIVGYLPPSGKKKGVDDAVYGVAVWESVDPEADKLSIYVKGLSDGFQEAAAPNNGEPATLYKTLRIDILRPGDKHNPSERELRLAEPPFEWVYWR
jgi:hypothetical protein